MAPPEVSMVRARLGAASAILAVALSSLLVTDPVAAADTPASRAVAYLFAAQSADGSLGGSPGQTEDYILGAAATGFDPATLVACSGTSAFDYLAANIAGATADAGKTAKLILAVVAGHRSPAAFGGTDLLARLETDRSSGTGAYGDGSTFSQSLAILALHAAGLPMPTDSIAYLASLQDADGSWNYGAKADAIAGDTNSTAVALMALAAAGSSSAVPKALTWLHGQQLADGGFPYQGGSDATSDPDSDALVIEALTAVGESPSGAAWAVGGDTPVSNLLTFQAADGGFIFPGNKAPDTFTTSEVPEGLAGTPPDRVTTFTPGLAPATRGCRTPEPSAHPTAHPGVAGPTLPPTSTRPAADEARPGAATLILVVLALAASAAIAARSTVRR